MLKAIIAAYKNHSNYRTTYNELSRLSDKELRDLGLDRSDIEHVARGVTPETVETKKSDFFATLFRADTEKNRINDYLSESANLVDLENRLKNIDRGLAPWQIRARNFAQGWAL
jgi:uncharacterized protein YjiS (DUF1127 family)